MAQRLVLPAQDGTRGYRLQCSNLDLRGGRGDRIGTNGAGNGVVSRVARRAAVIRAKRQPAAPITGAVAAVNNRVGSGQHVSNKGDNHDHDHNHIEEVIHNNNDHCGFPVIAAQLEQPANRR